MQHGFCIVPDRKMINFSLQMELSSDVVLPQLISGFASRHGIKCRVLLGANLLAFSKFGWVGDQNTFASSDVFGASRTLQ